VSKYVELAICSTSLIFRLKFVDLCYARKQRDPLCIMHIPHYCKSQSNVLLSILCASRLFLSVQVELTAAKLAVLAAVSFAGKD